MGGDMPRQRALTICTTTGCPEYTESGRCEDCRAKAETRRGSAKQRGYGGRGWTRARRAVLTRDPLCVLGCGRESTVADHWPVSRRDLVEQGVADPDAPERMRALCRPCHSSETAREQPGGWNR
jgi:5-methylcytosine-specific restriction protein A